MSHAPTLAAHYGPAGAILARLSELTSFDLDDVAAALAEIPSLERPTAIEELAWLIVDRIESWAWTITEAAASHA